MEESLNVENSRYGSEEALVELKKWIIDSMSPTNSLSSNELLQKLNEACSEHAQTEALRIKRILEELCAEKVFEMLSVRLNAKRKNRMQNTNKNQQEQILFWVLMDLEESGYLKSKLQGSELFFIPQQAVIDSNCQDNQESAHQCVPLKIEKPWKKNFAVET